MENIISIIDPVPGKTYTVTCAHINISGKSKFIPIIGQKHSDNQFGFSTTHYHIDGRFTDHENRGTGYTNAVIAPDIWSGPNFVGLVEKRKVCKRIVTGLNPPRNPKPVQRKSAALYDNWVKSMIGKSCKGRKCPHLNQEMHLIDGVLVCPLHNLRGCPEKEIIIG